MADAVEELPESTCLQLLASGGVGRIAINADPSPLVVPVNYAARERTVVFTTVEGSKWQAAQAGDAASFEVDGVDPDRRSGWSVLVRGRLEVVDEHDEDDEIAALLQEVDTLPRGERPHVVRLTAEHVSGRRIPQDSAWAKAHRRQNTWTGQDGTDLLG